MSSAVGVAGTGGSERALNLDREDDFFGAVALRVFGIALLFLPGRFPGRYQMVVFALGIMSDLEDNRTEAAAAPSDCAKLFRIISLSVNQIRLVKDLLRFFQADPMFSLYIPALPPIELEAQRRI
jgi:hypothetical protein